MIPEAMLLDHEVRVVNQAFELGSDPFSSDLIWPGSRLNVIDPLRGAYGTHFSDNDLSSPKAGCQLARVYTCSRVS